MGGRSKPNWVVFEGGPLHGQRQILPPTQGAGAVVHTRSVSPGLRVPHEYVVTQEVRKGGFHESAARVARFVRTLPEEPEPPLPLMVHPVGGPCAATVPHSGHFPPSGSPVRL